MTLRPRPALQRTPLRPYYLRRASKTNSRGDSTVNIRIATFVQAAGPQCQDRAAVFETPEGRVIVVADGVGGIGAGAAAAEAVLESIRRHPPSEKALAVFGYAARELLALDDALCADPQCGETTAVVLAVGHGLIAGASVGDSEAWLIEDAGYTVLTASQSRSPVLGSGAAVPRAFRTEAAAGRLLVATDGLFHYAAPDAICAAACSGEPQGAAEALLALVRLPSGAIQDDVAIVLCDLSDEDSEAPPDE